MRRALVFVLLWVLGPLAASAQVLQKERTQVRTHLAAERAALALTQGQQANVLEAMGWMQALARASADRAAAVARETKALEKRLAVAEQNEALARETMGQQLAKLGPRLTSLYRMTRRSRLDVLLSAPDVAQMFWRAWALRKLLKSDLALVDETQAVARYQDRARRRLEGLREAALTQKQMLTEVSAHERENVLDLKDAVALLQAKARTSHTALKDMERSEHELNRLIQQLEQMPVQTGFGTLRGKLPLPAEGTMEVGFGRVVNPRFNTVVEHKGLDIRAPAGAPVRAVAEGRVVWTGALRGYGNLLIVDHGNGYHTLMAHLGDTVRAIGDEVKSGDEIAKVGDSGSLKGAYLYFEVRARGLAVDPAPWFERL